MLKEELQQLFEAMPQLVKDKLQPVMDNLLERAADLDAEKNKTSEYYEEEREDIMKEVHKVKYLNDQWQIMNARKNN
ncbi:hypothetical protein AM493_02605 [Flavobacterium akiainvivens]|uniref:Uncharacterized protein n=1 Tax=Flavobacterium akiainvivens TaxID=1202724 RepID=A0A0M9VH13_9FLAO|nr:hypothetical protein [Flavobacterium akiainvivens]KOS05046.1 hypothetical protein AM493_02605 [Flavobacterium akiainvivens]SFQ52251.1 hypothetical protein SAMN05444144_106283 [Flavobacterium akiainvivens]